MVLPFSLRSSWIHQWIYFSSKLVNIGRILFLCLQKCRYYLFRDVFSEAIFLFGIVVFSSFAALLGFLWLQPILLKIYLSWICFKFLDDVYNLDHTKLISLTKVKIRRCIITSFVQDKIPFIGLAPSVVVVSPLVKRVYVHSERWEYKNVLGAAAAAAAAEKTSKFSNWIPEIEWKKKLPNLSKKIEEERIKRGQNLPSPFNNEALSRKYSNMARTSFRRRY